MLQEFSQALHKIRTTISLAQPGYPLLCRCTKSAAPPQYWWHLIINLSPTWSGLTNSNTHRLLGVVCCMRHQPSLAACVTSSPSSAQHVHHWHASSPRHVQHHVLPPRKRLVLHNIVCIRQDTFLVLHGIVPECLLHSSRQLNSIPRLSGQNSDFPAEFHQTH